jgi:hypothetical protein
LAQQGPTEPCLGVDFLDDTFVGDGLLNQLFDVVHAWLLVGVIVDEFDDIGAEFHADESVGEGVIEAVPFFLSGCIGCAGDWREDSTTERPISHDEILGIFLEFGDEKEVMVDLATASMANV